ncbi:hypothetical protein [Nesterenkonia populi]
MVGTHTRDSRAPTRAPVSEEAPQPGSVYPLRPLGLNETFSAAMAVIRHSPKAALGVPFAAGAATLLLTLLTSLVLPSPMNRLLADPAAYDDQELALAVMADGAFLAVSMIIGFFASLLWLAAAALLITPALRSGLGLRTSFGQTLRQPPAVWGRLALHLGLLTILLFLVALIGTFVAVLIIAITMFIGALFVVPAALLGTAWGITALIHAPLVIVSERRGAFSAISRSLQLNRGLWWRNMGAVSLLMIMVLVIATAAAFPVGLLTGFAGAESGAEGPDEGIAPWMMIGMHVVENAVSAVGMALAGAGAAMIHISSRIRQEALDVRLSRAAARTHHGEAAPSPAELAHAWRAP